MSQGLVVNMSQGLAVNMSEDHLGVDLVSTLREGNSMMPKFFFRILIFFPLLISPPKFTSLTTSTSSGWATKYCQVLFTHVKKEQKKGDWR